MRGLAPGQGDFYTSRMSQKLVRPALYRRRSCSGFTLVEVLVAIVILSIGVLGAVGMQVAAMQSNKEVRVQAVANSLARDLAEKMRSNPVVASKTAAADNPYLISVTLSKSSAPTVPGTNCYTGACPTQLNIADWDIYEWQLRAKDALPSPRIVICMDADPFDSDGKPKWACSNTGDVPVLKLAWTRTNTQGELEFTSSDATLPFLVIPMSTGNTPS